MLLFSTNINLSVFKLSVVGTKFYLGFKNGDLKNEYESRLKQRGRRATIRKKIISCCKVAGRKI